MNVLTKFDEFLTTLSEDELNEMQDYVNLSFPHTYSERLRQYVTGTGQCLRSVHSPDQCVGEHCIIHNPSDHSMRDWPTHWRGDRGIMERLCKHGTGHPDPDQRDYLIKLFGGNMDKVDAEFIHGCCGCCTGRNE